MKPNIHAMSSAGGWTRAHRMDLAVSLACTICHHRINRMSACHGLSLLFAACSVVAHRANFVLALCRAVEQGPSQIVQTTVARFCARRHRNKRSHSRISVRWNILTPSCVPVGRCASSLASAYWRRFSRVTWLMGERGPNLIHHPKGSYPQ